MTTIISWLIDLLTLKHIDLRLIFCEEGLFVINIKKIKQQ